MNCSDSSSTMSELTSLQVFFTQRLTAAAVEIFTVVEKTVVEYQNEIRRSKEENERLQRTLDLVFKPDVKLHRGDLQQFSLPVSEEEDPPEQQQHHGQEWNSSLGQKNPETPQIEQEFRTSQQEEPLQGLQFDIKEFIFTPPSVNRECGQKDSLQLSHLYQTGESRERDSLPTNTTEQFKTEPDGEDYGVSEPTRDSWPLFEVNPDSSAEQSDNIESDEGVKGGGLQSGIKPLKIKRTCSKKGQISSINTEDRKTSQGNVSVKPHSGQKPYRCAVCSKCLTTLSLLKIHQRIHSVQCELCGKCFSRKGNLNRHMLIHTGEKPYRCEVCGKRFVQTGQLLEHTRTHTGERPFKCSTCGKCFNSERNLKVHQRIHTGEKRHCCNNCGKRFSHKISLKNHLINVHEKNT